jgi:basic membrane protein A
MNNLKKLLIAAVILSVSIFAAAGCSQNQAADQSAGTDETAAADENAAAGLEPIAKEDIKAAFIYGSAVGEEGYSYAHDLGRLALEAAGYQATYVESIPETDRFEKTVRDLIEQGYNVIYATSYGYGKYVEALADEYPNVYFNHATGEVTKENMATYMGRLYQSQYLAGIAAGLRTETNRIGYVVSFPLPEVVSQVNGFTLGVRSVNPDAVVEVKWTNSWYDPPVETNAGLELVNTGADVVIAYLDTMSAQLAAAEKGAWVLGCSTSGASVAPDHYLTAPIFNWAEYYVPNAASIVDGSWSGRFEFLGLDSGVVDVDELTDNNAPGAREAVGEAKAAILNGSLDVFAGEIRDNDGNVRVAAGESLSDEEILTLDWFVEGVNGSIN